jgi:hypothetical protein
MATTPCVSCGGSGELPTDYGLRDCPDCGGSGQLPARAVVTAWRCRDLMRQVDSDTPVQGQDVRWLLAELDAARTALNEIIAVAHDLPADEPLAFRIRMQASAALGLYELVRPGS